MPFNSSLYSSYGCVEDNKTLQWQGTHLVIAHHPLFSAERVPKILDFVWNCRVNFGRNTAACSIWGPYMLSKATPKPHHASNEGYETLQQQWVYLIPVQHPISCPERVLQIWCFCVQFESQPLPKWYNVNHEGRVYVFRSFFTLPYESKEAQEPLQQQCMSLLAVQHPFCRCQEGTPNLAFCVQFES